LTCAGQQDTLQIADTRQNAQFAEGRDLLPCASRGASFVVCSYSLSCALAHAHSKGVEKMLILPLQMFLVSTYCAWDSKLNFSIFSVLLLYLTILFLENDFWGTSQTCITSIFNSVTMKQKMIFTS